MPAALREAREGYVAVVSLDRPDHGNAINEALAFELREASLRLERDDAVRVVMLAGEGNSFCEGTDPSAEKAAMDGEKGLEGLRVSDAVAAIGKPVVAAIDGPAVDQGLELALACDLRVAGAGASFALEHLRRGLIPWDGGTQRLPRLVGASRALEMVLTRRRLDAQEALAIGLVGEVAEGQSALERALTLAQAVARQGPIAARYLKEAVLKGLDVTIDQGLRLEADLNVILQGTADRREGLRSFAERRMPPVFRGE